MNAINDSSVEIHHQTQNKFYVFLENQFLVLPNAKTVVGADGLDRKKLMIENITERNPTKIGRHSDEILSILFDSLTQTLLVGDRSGHVKQYKKRKKSTVFGPSEDPFSFTLLKDYGNVGVDQVLSSAQVGGFVIFGGDNRSLIAINISEQWLCKGKIKSPFVSIFSLQVCDGLESNIYLSVGGEYPNYSSGLSDYLDVSQVNKNKKSDTIQCSQEINKLQTMLPQKNESIHILKVKIKHLEADIQKQKKQNQGNIHPKICKRKLKPFSRKSTYSKQKTRKC